MRKLVIASNNVGKIKEIMDLLESRSLDFLSLKDIGPVDAILEDQDSFEGNALKKAFEIMAISKEPTLADDSGLEVDLLDGEPGVLSARFSGEDASDEDNNKKLLTLLQGVPLGKRGAQFRCVIALVCPNGTRFTAEGVCRGKIAETPMGSHGFGYDPIFIPKGYDRTFAQLEANEKNLISHRSIALHKMKRIMQEKGLLD